MVDASVTAPLVWVTAAVLVMAGAGKLHAPAAAADAMRSAELPAGPVSARLAGAVELSVGVAALVAPTTASLAAMAVLYALLAIVAVRLVRSSAPAASCGCFGADAPPSRLHAAFDAGAAVVAAVLALAPPPGLPGEAANAPIAGVGLVVGCATAAYAVSLALRHLPQAATAYRPARRPA